MNTISTSKPKLFSTLGQICKLIPVHLVAKLARETGVEAKARTFTPWSHEVTLLYAQLAYALSLNDVCDALSFVTGRLQGIRGAKARHATPFPTPIANAIRNWPDATAFASSDAFIWWTRPRSPLVANCMDWARYRRRKAAAKCHVRMDWGSLLPQFVVVGSAGGDDSVRMAELRAGVKPGEIVVLDKAYVAFDQLHALHARA